ncbi:MAG TPA: DNA sulfur modification protein DndB [Azospirillaceae bacterium]|nr:DNA sulfur modification protein DndB [Azospirillaceae bacterium]
MATVIPAIRGKIGNTEYFETTMKVRDLVYNVRRASELDEWANFSIEERMQRELDEKRVREQIVPYLANNADRFFGSIIVLVYKGEVSFESLGDLKLSVPGAYKASLGKMGFLAIDGGTLIVLDGQHRLAALKAVYDPRPDGSVAGPFVKDIPEDEVCVVFVRHEDSVKTRRIFNTVNRYARQTGRGDNIITSEDDGYAIVARRLLREDEPLGNRQVAGKPFELVNWRSNTMSPRSKQLTTISAVYESVQLILGGQFYQGQARPEEERLDEGSERAGTFWQVVLNGIEAYRQALANPEGIPAMRDEASDSALLFKPAAQVALIKGLLAACTQGRLALDEAVRRANGIDWRISAPAWQGVIIKQSGAIDAGQEAKNRAASLIAWLVAADVMPPEEREQVRRNYNLAFGIDVSEPGNSGEARPLPTPVVAVPASA